MALALIWYSQELNGCPEGRYRGMARSAFMNTSWVTSSAASRSRVRL